jgi:hypothetical protein
MFEKVDAEGKGVRAAPVKIQLRLAFIVETNSIFFILPPGGYHRFRTGAQENHRD